MVFSSLLFLYVFLPATFLLYYMFKSLRMKNLVLMFMSVLFYAWGEPFWVILMLFTAMVNYLCGRAIDAYRGTAKAKAAVIFCAVITLSLLGAFKYLNFFLGNIGFLIGTNIDAINIGLPIGISFYTFQTLTYTIDLYRGNVKVQKSYFNLLMYVSLFPQLIAGPIVRYSDIEGQITSRTVTFEKMAEGIIRFTCGLAKKVLIANAAGLIAVGTKEIPGILEGNLAALPAGDALLGILMYAFQIYFDFSGYSDMAIGLGKMFGFDFMENFKHPYISGSITEFWRRWHISLSTFFRDYVYIPLGGNKRHQVLNLFIVWGLTGLWHGASWNFVLWGLYYFIFLVIEKFILFKLPKKLNAFMGAVYTLPVVLMGWVLFYFTDTSRMFEFIKALFDGTGSGFAGVNTASLWLENMPLIVIAVVSSTPAFANLFKGIKEKVRLPLSYVYTFGILFLCTQALVGQTYNPFIYFRF